MFPEKIEEGFDLSLEAIQLLQNALKSSYLDAYVEHIENIIDQYQVRVIDGVPDEQTVNQLTRYYEKLAGLSLEPEEKRKLAQLLLLKGSRTEPLQPNHQLTPDSIGFLFVYLLEQLTSKKQSLRILDPAVGMGNLLLTVISNLELSGYKVEGIGVDIDETLLAIAAANGEWMEANLSLFHQDALQELLVDPMDAVISDLPVGFYPHNERAKDFLSAAETGHSYAHHLLMEQAMKYVKPGGFGLFLIPTNFLETDQSVYLKNWLKENIYLQGMVQLPEELFKNQQSQKSILLIQNKGEGTKQAPEVLLAKVASLKEPKKITNFFQQFQAWKAENLS